MKKLLRDLGNIPPNIMTPAYLAGHAEKLGKKLKLSGLRNLSQKEMENLELKLCDL